MERIRKGIIAITAMIFLLSLASVKAFDVVPGGDEFQINTQTVGVQNRPAAAMDANGNFVVVWTSVTTNVNTTGVFAQRFDSNPNPSGGEFKVSEFGATPGGVSVAMDAGGDFVIAWHMAQGHDGSGFGIFAKRYDAAGNELSPPPGVQGNGVGNEFQVNSFTTGDQREPSAAMDANGNFAIAWGDFNGHDGDGFGIFAKRYNATGNELPPPSAVQGNGIGNEFQVNTFSTSNQFVPSAVMAPNGAFIITWFSLGQDGGFDGVFAKRYDAAGNELSPPLGVQGSGSGNEFQVNNFKADFQFVQQEADVAVDAQGNFVVTWGGTNGQDGSSGGVFAKRYDANGNELAPPPAVQGNGVCNEFQVNTRTLLSQGLPSVALDADGNFVIAWYSQLQDAFTSSIYAKAYDASGSEVVPSFDQGNGLGNEFRVNTFTASLKHFRPRVAMDSNSNFVVAWENTNQDGDNAGIFARRFEVIARTPSEAIQNLIDQVQALVTEGVLNNGQGNALITKLEAALNQLNQGNVQAAINQLHAFIKQVSAFITARILLPEEGQPLIGAANDIISQLSDMQLPTQGGTLVLSPEVVVSVSNGTFNNTVRINYDRHAPVTTNPLNNIGLFFELNATHLDGSSTQPQQPFEITITYDQADVPANVIETELALYSWNGCEWVEETTSVVDAVANTIVAQPNHFSLWTVLAGPPSIYLPIVFKFTG